MDEFEFGCGENATGKGNLRFRHGCSPLLLATLPYPEKERMSSEKCKPAKKSHELGARTVMQDSDCRGQSAKMCRQRAGGSSREKWRILGWPRLEKSMIEWVERQFETAGSHSMQNKWSS
jgi:hypothetical protein